MLTLNSLQKFWIKYKILQVDSNSYFFFILFGFQAIFKFPSWILKETLNSSSGLNSFYSAPFEFRSKKTRPSSKASHFNCLRLTSVGNTRDNSTLPETPANHIKVPLPHTDFQQTQKLTSKKKQKNTHTQYKIGPELTQKCLCFIQ